MDETTPLAEHANDPEPPAEPAPPIQSRFLFVDVAALRAKQLRRGARMRFDPDGTHKAERVAMEEVRRGLVQYTVPPLPGREHEGAAAGRTQTRSEG